MFLPFPQQIFILESQLCIISSAKYCYYGRILNLAGVLRGLVVKCVTHNLEVTGSSHTGSSGFFSGNVLGQDTSESPSLVPVTPGKCCRRNVVKITFKFVSVLICKFFSPHFQSTNYQMDPLAEPTLIFNFLSISKKKKKSKTSYNQS